MNQEQLYKMIDASVKSRIGKPLSPEHKKKLLGRIPWNKGIKTGIKPWLGKKRLDMTGENNPNWAGDSVGYSGVHIWLAKNFEKPKKCEHCGRTDQKRYEWANLSGKYPRDRSDYIILCKRCHNNFDGTNAWQNRGLK